MFFLFNKFDLHDRMIDLPYDILQFVQGAANQQAALCRLFCEYGLAYESMDGSVCAMPLYQGMGMAEMITTLRRLIKKAQPTMTVQGDLHVHGDYIESGATKNVTTTIEHVDHYHAEEPARAHDTINIPAENNYQMLAQWLEQEKAAGRDYLAEAGDNKALMARKVSDVVGWTIDEHSLRRAINRRK